MRYIMGVRVLNGARKICYKFLTLNDYFKSQNYSNHPKVIRILLEHLIKKIKMREIIDCMIQERGDKSITFVPSSLIEDGRAERGMRNKNIIIVSYRIDCIEIEFDCRNKKKYYLKEDINDELIEKIIMRYQNIR